MKIVENIPKFLRTSPQIFETEDLSDVMEIPFISQKLKSVSGFQSISIVENTIVVKTSTNTFIIAHIKPS